MKAVIHGSTFVAQQMLRSHEWNKAFLFSYNNVQSTLNTATAATFVAHQMLLYSPTEMQFSIGQEHIT